MTVRHRGTSIVATIVLIAGVSGACSGPSHPPRPGPSPVPSATGGPASLARFQRLPNPSVCALVPSKTIASALGVPASKVHHDPAATDPGQCDWTAPDGSHVDVLFPAVTWAAAKQVVVTRKIAATDSTVAGHPMQSFPVFENVTCDAALGGDADPTLDIEAPDAAACRSVATAVFTSLRL